MRYLICDLNIQNNGHYIGYSQYILDNITQLEEAYPDRTYSFLYNHEAKTYLKFPIHLEKRVHFINDNCRNNFSIRAKIALFKRVVVFAKEFKTEHLIFMDLDQYQFSIFVSSFSFKLSGVLFRPHHRITASANTFVSRISSKIQRTKKILAEKFLTTTKEVENIYILNDDEGVNYLNKFHKTVQFKYLSDPIFSYPSSLQKIKDNKNFKFLIFGSMSERKNITNIIKAFDAAHFNIETELIIVGSAQEAYLTYLNTLIKDLTTIGSQKKIILKLGFVTDEEMDNYFHETDVCLLIYKDFFGSSGLLGRATLHKKKVIGANVGLLKELIEQNKLGITCDPKSIEEIAKALVKITDTDIEIKNLESFYLKYLPDKFLKTLLN